MTKTGRERPKTDYFWIVFFALTVFVYFFGLTIPLVGPDEPRYAQVAREMSERGDWITPTLGGFNWFEKPPLLYWLQIVSYNVFGVSEFAARFGSALFGLGIILSLWILGRFAATESTEVSEIHSVSKHSFTSSVSSVAKDFANWLALIAASSIGIIVFSRGASFDIILTFPMTAALVSFYIFDLTQRRKDGKSQSNETFRGQDIIAFTRLGVSISLFAFYFFIGVSLLAKGLIGIVFPFAIVAFYYLLSWRRPGRTLILSLFWGTPVAIAVASIWYLPMYLVHGYAFVDEFFIQHHFTRYTSNKYFHPQPFYFFFWVLPLMTIPWLPFFFAAIWDYGKKVFHHRGTEAQREKLNKNASNENQSEADDFRVPASPSRPFFPSPLLLFAVAWLLIPLVFFSFSGSKLPGYVLPALPAAIVLTAEYVHRFVQKSTKRVLGIMALAIATYVAVISLLLFSVPRFAESDTVKWLIEAADERGFTTERILTLHTISHNAEFYAAGRLLRGEDGRQKKLLGPAHVLEAIRRENGKPVLVLVPLEYLKQLTDSDLLATEVIKDNGELAIVHASAK